MAAASVKLLTIICVNKQTNIALKCEVLWP